MTLYVAQRECGDYYCGCGGGHIVGVFTVEDAAVAAVEALGGQTRVTEVEADAAKGAVSEWGGFEGAWT